MEKVKKKKKYVSFLTKNKNIKKKNKILKKN